MLSSLSEEVRASFLERHALLRERAAAIGEELPAVTAEGMQPAEDQQRTGMPEPEAGLASDGDASAVSNLGSGPGSYVTMSPMVGGWPPEELRIHRVYCRAHNHKRPLLRQHRLQRL